VDVGGTSPRCNTHLHRQVLPFGCQRSEAKVVYNLILIFIFINIHHHHHLRHHPLPSCSPLSPPSPSSPSPPPHPLSNAQRQARGVASGRSLVSTSRATSPLPPTMSPAPLTRTLSASLSSSARQVPSTAHHSMSFLYVILIFLISIYLFTNPSIFSPSDGRKLPFRQPKCHLVPPGWRSPPRRPVR
jgi:hypothetical protein